MASSRGGVVASLRFELLGHLRAVRGAEEIDLGPAKQRAVLAVLLLNAGRAVPTGRIVDAVWGDEPPENGANVVQKYVAGLRRVLDPDRSPRTPGELIALTPGGYQLTVDADALDVEQFRSGVAAAAAERRAGRLAEASDLLRRALDRWHGPALAGLSGGRLDAARDGLTEEHATAWEAWAEIELARGQHAAVIPELVGLIAEFPMREGLRALLMLALHRAGRQAEALAVFVQARRYLTEEFGVEPGARLQETHREILRGEPAPFVPPGPFVPPPAAPFSPAPAASVAATAPRRNWSLAEFLFAGLTPLVVCSFGSWIYFAVAAFRRRNPRLLFVSAGYLAAFLVLFATVGESDEDSAASLFGMLGLLLLPGAASMHGMLMATHPGGSARREALRANARLLAQADPAQARAIGIGRPDLPTEFDDGGLVDVNHAPGHELAKLRGINSDLAHRIVMDRHLRGPYRQVEDLVVRGLITPASLHRLGSRLVCVAPAVSRPSEHPPR